MRVDFSQETSSGPVKFTGNLTEDEVMFFVEYAIIDLVKRGFMPMSITRDPDQTANHPFVSMEKQ